MGPNASENLQKLAQTLKNLAKASKNLRGHSLPFNSYQEMGVTHTHPNRHNAWTRPKPGARHGGRAGGGRVRAKKLKIFRKCPNASERIRTHPNASKCIRTCPNRSEQVQKLQKTCKNLEKFAKICEKFAKKFAKACS